MDRDILKDWVYAEQRVKSTFDFDLIAHHAKAHMARSLNSRKLIAVIGSGVSQAYGLPTWEQLLKNVAAKICKNIHNRSDKNSVKIYMEGNDKNKLDEATKALKAGHPHIVSLIDMFKAENLDNPALSIKKEKFTLLFEICENLFADLHIYDLETGHLQFTSLSGELEKARSHLRECLKWQIRDDRGRIEFLVSEPCLIEQGKTKQDAYDAYIKVINDCLAYPNAIGDPEPDANKDMLAALFALVFYKGISSHVIEREIPGGEASTSDNSLNEILKKLRQFDEAKFGLYLPTSAHSNRPIPLLDFVHAFDNQVHVNSKQWHDLKPAIDACFISMSIDDKLSYVEGVRDIAKALAAKRETAQEIIRKARTDHHLHLDPLAILHRELGVKRYLTTNYDAEFDKWLESIGYAEVQAPLNRATLASASHRDVVATGSQSILLDQFNSRAEIIAFEPGSVADLFDYGADTRDNRLQILHIHGRIRKRESWLVLSEPDYQARYARDGRQYVGSDDAMRLIFNANPLLFLGLGMTEDDILRPLRTFAITDGRLAERPAIAVLPAIGEDDDRRAQKAMLMSRYSVFFMYYGAAHVRQTSEKGDEVVRHADCLRHIHGVISALWNLLDALSNKNDASASDDPALVQARGAVGAAMKKLGPYYERDDEKINSNIIDIEGSKQHAIDVNTVLFYCIKLSDTLLNEGYSAENVHIFALKYLLKGVGNVLITSFFCAFLRLMLSDTKEWRSQWGVSPSPRERFGQEVGAGLIQAGPQQRYRKFSYRSKSESHNSFGDEILDVHAESIRQVIMLRNLEAEDNALVEGYSRTEHIRDFSKNTDLSPSSKAELGPEVKLANTLQHANIKKWAGRLPVAPHTDRFFAGNPSQDLIALRAALTYAPIASPEKGRRIFMFLGDNGAGRGHIFSTLRSPKRFNHLCHWIDVIKEPPPSPMDADTVNDKVIYGYGKDVPRAFYNLGLSHEIVSIFDRLIQFLQNIILNDFDAEDKWKQETLKRQLDKLSASRVQRFHFLMEYLNSRKTLNHSRRIVIVFNSIDNLFNTDGHPKNSQVGRLFNILINEKYRQVPIDFIFLMKHRLLPQMLRDQSKVKAFRALAPLSSSKENRAGDVVFFDALGVDWHEDQLKPHSEMRPGYAAAEAKPVDRDDEVYLHRLQSMQPVTFSMLFFPKVAVALYYLGLKTEGGKVRPKTGSQDTLVNYTHNADRDVLRYLVNLDDGVPHGVSDPAAFKQDVNAYLDAHSDSEIVKLYHEWEVSVPAHKRGKYKKNVLAFLDASADGQAEKQLLLKDGCNPNVLLFLKASRSELERLNLDELNKQFYIYNIFYIQRQIRDTFDNVVDDVYVSHEVVLRYASIFSSKAIERVSLRIILWHLVGHCPTSKPDKKMSSGLIIRLRKILYSESLGPTLSRRQRVYDYTSYYFDSLNRAAGQSRFCLTMIMAAIDDMIERRLNSFPNGLAELNPILQFMERLMLASSGLTPSLRAETVVEQVLMNYKTDFYNSFNTPMGAWPFEFRKAHPNEEETIFKADNHSIYKLQENILVALALIGQPVTAAALLGVRDVASSFQRLFQAAGDLEGDDSPECEALLSQKRRKYVELFMDLLVHRCLILRIYPKNNPENDEYHYTIHSSIRRYFLSKMNAPNVNYSEIDQLAVSIYSSQPNEMPKPTAEGYRRIRKLIDGLSQYENLPYHPYYDPYFKGCAPDEQIRVKRMRLRAAFGALRSFYSINVVSRFSSYVDEGVVAPDYGYFEAHRRRVRWMLRKAYELDDLWRVQIGPNYNPELFSFFAEEIVWLFNECGVVCLAQGCITEAIALLNQARVVANQFIEKDDWGSLNARIGLNFAIADIECGRLREAGDQLRRIVDDKTETEPLIRMAEGYLAYILSLKGDHDTAIVQFEKVISELASTERFRAAAIFLIHQAETYLRMGKSSYAKAEHAAMKARDLAANGGHEDIRQLSILVYCWYEILHLGGACSRIDKKKIHDTLDQLDAYAKTMGMPQITSRVALLRAQFLMFEGEYLLAADTVQLALLTATRHDLELTKISALSLLGAAMSKLGMSEAKHLLIRSRELAIQADYVAEINRIDSVLNV